MARKFPKIRLDVGKRFKYKIVLHKNYFDNGFSLLNYLKYGLAAMGIANFSYQKIFWIGFIYAVVCYFVGRWWIKYGWYETQHEVSNNNNQFVKQMRRKMRRRKI